MKLRRFVVAFVLTLLVLAFFSWILSAPPQTLEERQAAGAGRQGHPTQAVGNQEANERKTETTWDRQQKNEVNNLVRRIMYMQDLRTTPPICYAYVYTALASVPCEAIPSDLLIVATAK